MVNAEEQMLTRAQVAKVLQVHLSTVKRLDAEGALPRQGSGRIVRYRAADVLKCLNDRKAKSAETGVAQ